MVVAYIRKINVNVVQQHWDSYFRKILLLETTPGVVDHEFRASNILKAICEDRLTVWALKEGDKIQAIFSTCIAGEGLSGSRSLLLYSIYGFGNFTKKAMQEISDLLAEEARKMSCTSIILYTQLPSVMKAAAAMGCKTYFTMVKEIK